MFTAPLVSPYFCHRVGGGKAMYYKVEISGVDTSKLKTLKNDETNELLRRAHAGDREARNRLVESNLKLVLSAVQRFSNRGGNPDDLFQVGCIGLIKAIERFDIELGLKLSTYAFSLIIGEMRRFLRDSGMVKVTRRVREQAVAALKKKEELQNLDVVLSNPPFGTKKGGELTNRTDFMFATSNKQFNFLQHIYHSLNTSGKARAAVVVPDNVLFADGDGEKIRCELMDKCNLHTILRLPTGIFYAQGVKTNVLFFTRGKSDYGNTKEVWFYDLRTDMPSYGKTTPLKVQHFADFELAYNASIREKVCDKRWSVYTREEIRNNGNNLDLGLIQENKDEDHESISNPIENLEMCMSNLEEAKKLITCVIEELKTLEV